MFLVSAFVIHLCYKNTSAYAKIIRSQVYHRIGADSIVPLIGLSIGFHAKDKVKLKPEETNIKKLPASIGDYFTLNVTFGEDDNFVEYEEDYIYVEQFRRFFLANWPNL